ncbi:MAG TPA: ferritin-like domain-containing protein [Myxococcales bacterium]|nr:ferritin-like domain-containing protein [Myxococcales bacterium]
MGADLFAELAATAESARWKLADVPWSSFEPARATAGLRALVREMAFFEQATFSATQKFMQAFADDLAFTQWVSVWFYEETRHPLVLMRWLELAGESCDDAFVARGRVSAPFMRSRTGTLVTNVISEITAAGAYLALAQAAPEPLLAELARRVAGDEARHAASFFRFARQRIERSAGRDRERLDAIKVLHFWLNESANVTHPVNQTMERLRGLEPVSGVRADAAALRARICGVVGLLADVPLGSPDDVPAVLVELTGRLHAGA